MTWTYTPYAGVLWATACISAYCTYVIWRRPKTAGIYSLIALMGAATIWALTSGFEAASVGLQQKLIWAKLEYIGVVSVPTLFFTFSLDYSLRGNRLKLRHIILLSIVPLIGLILAFSNEAHHLIWKDLSPSPLASNSGAYGHGIGFYILVGYLCILALAGLGLLVRAWLKFPVLYRRQINILGLAFLFPFVGGMLYALGWTPLPALDIPPLSFFATDLVLLVGIFSHQLFDLVPITSEALIENMLDGVLVLDAFSHIANVNSVAKKLVRSLSKRSIGQPVEIHLDFWDDLQKRYKNAPEIRTEIVLDREPPCYLDVHVSSLFDRYKHFAGRLIVMRDTTERKQIESDLARNVEELKIINRISLIISSGLDMERTLKALYEQCSRVVPSDVFYVALYNPSSSLVNIPLYYEKGKYLTGISRDIRDQPGLIGSVIRARRTLYLHDGIKQITRPVVPSDTGSTSPINSYIGIPLTVRDQVIGVMAIQSHRLNAYTDDQVRLLERIAIQAAIAIENARLYAEEQRLAIIDELTGVYNYRGLLELGSREVERARRFNRPLAAIFFDIDDFRNLNNTYSHTAGNLVLKEVVKRCASVLRSVDVLTRFGGDEFVALLPETGAASANGVAHRLTQEIAAAPVSTSYGDLQVRISVGVTLLTKDMPDLAALVESANQAERQVKLNQKRLNAALLKSQAPES